MSGIRHGKTQDATQLRGSSINLAAHLQTDRLLDWMDGELQLLPPSREVGTDTLSERGERNVTGDWGAALNGLAPTAHPWVAEQLPVCPTCYETRGREREHNPLSLFSQ